MKDLYSKYRLQVVKEAEVEYDCGGQVPRQMTNPESTAALLCDVLEMDKEAEEICVMLSLDSKNRVTGMFEVSRGNLNQTMIHPREFFKRALSINAHSIIIAHNHPSGDTTPSIADLSETRRLLDAGELIGVPLADHLIIGDNKTDFYSFRGQSPIKWD